ncbi:hypothetical protein BDZ89DRAFT_953570 [Hymenopellis radicata]|nr:hypothetical protein BDZ89DRAFT_953570 [Hymenopellis radicata]
MAREVSGYVTRPFWEGLPYTDIHLAITPDVLHQLYQGVLKHLIEWCQIILTKEELDRRIHCLPPGLGLRHFKNGISALSQISGSERKNMEKILLGCLIGTCMSTKGITACRAILDFIYLAQYSTHDDDTLTYMVDALKTWQENQDYFIFVGVREDLNIPKFHSLMHYVDMIKFLGMTNNFNTEMFKRLHIDFAKKAWRASNKCDEAPQMTRWILRQEGVQMFERQLPPPLPTSSRTPISSTSTTTHTPTPPTTSLKEPQPILLPKFPTSPNKSITLIQSQHRVPLFGAHLKEYLDLLQRAKSKKPATSYPLPFHGVDVYHSFKFSLESVDDTSDEKDVVKASPLGGGRFDTVVVYTGDEAETTGLTGKSSACSLNASLMIE